MLVVKASQSGKDGDWPGDPSPLIGIEAIDRRTCFHVSAVESGNVVGLIG